MEGSCHFREHCPLFDERLGRLPGLSELFRKRYCEGGHDRCARHRLADMLGPSEVPDRLMPNEHEAASEIFKGYSIPN